jgi:hypothetical protein
MLVVHSMNKSHAVVLPKRMLYLEPVLVILVAGGIAMCVEIVVDIIKWVARQVKVTLPSVVSACVLGGVRVLMWMFLVKLLVWPVVSKGFYDVCQLYYTPWRATYKDCARFLDIHAHRGEVLWWYPPRNDAWLVERYMSMLCPTRPIPITAEQFTEARLTNSLATHDAVWLVGLNPSQYGFATQSYVTIPVAKSAIYVFRAAYVTNADVRAADAKHYLRSILTLSDYPEVETARSLIAVIGRQRSPTECDAIVEHTSRYHASAYASEYARAYYLSNNMPRQAAIQETRFADACFWMRDIQRRAAAVAMKQGLYSNVLACAQRMRWFGYPIAGVAEGYIGLAYLGMSNYPSACRWLGASQARLLGEMRRGANEAAMVFEVRDVYIRSLSACNYDADAIFAWLASWLPNDNPSRINEITTMLRAVRANPARWSTFARDARKHAKEHKWIPTFINLSEQMNDTQTVIRCVTEMMQTKDVVLWPLYVSVMSELPRAVSRQCLVSPSTLSQFGVNVPELYEASLLWLARFFEQYGGASAAIRFWDMVVQSNSPFGANAIVRQAMIERNQVSPSNAVARLRHNMSAVCQSLWARDRARETLKAIGSPEALAVLSAYEEHP